MKKKIFILVIGITTILFYSNLYGQTIIKTSFYSQSLEKTNKIHVFLPSCYDSNDDINYPVIYYLHGWGGNEYSANPIMVYADSLINNGIIDPVIIISMDNTATPFVGSFYVNSELNGNYEDYLNVELIQWVETNYNAFSNRNYRALFGHSMGAYGSFRNGILHKDLYRGFAAHAAPINLDLAIDSIALDLVNENQPGPPYLYNYNNSGLITQLVFAMFGAFIPTPSIPQTYIIPDIIEFPLDEQGVPLDSIYQKFRAYDPISYINTLSPNDSVAILFGAGRNDNLHLFPSNYAFRDTLDNLSITYEYFDHSGSHVMPEVFIDRALIFLDSILSHSGEIACFDPSDQTVSNITQTSVDLSWIENCSSSSWQIMLDTEGFDTTNYSPVLVDTIPYTWTGISENTNYDWYVRAVCDNNQFSNWVGPNTFSGVKPFDLPFIEDWENSDGEQYTNGQFYASNSFNWAFETNLQNQGRISWGTNTHLPLNGTGAMTMDRNPSSAGNYAINYATLTLDLSNYSESSNLELSFWWAEHGDEEHANDKVWIRGSDTDSWVVIYDLDPASITDDTYQFVSELDIDDILASASQTVSSSFQLRFGQEDDYNTDWDGLSFDDIKIEDKAPCSSCFDPSDQTVSNITQTSVDLSWIENCSSSSWQIMLDTEGFDTTNYSPVLVDTIPYTWTGISENTNYDWYVRAVCDNNQFSNWVGPNTFSGVKPFDLPFIEDWENSDGEQYTNGQFYASNSFNWAFETNLQNQGRISWGTNTHLPLNGTGAMTMDRNPSSAGNYAINYATLTLDLSNYSESSNLELSFWWAEHGDEEHANDKVWIRGSDTDSWVVIYDLDPASITDDTYQFVSELDIDDILASASQTVSSSFQLRFGQEDDYNTDWDGLSFDDIKIEDKAPCSSCFDPSDQTVSNITQTSVDLSWIENCSSSSWQIMLDTEGFDTTNYSPVLVDTIPYTWTGISENTNYDWYVRAVCDNNQFSNWVGPNTFSGVKPFDLPFIEDWENSDGEQYTNGQFYASNSFNWAFETNLQNQGRISWGTNTHLPLNGTGAMTMDRNPSSAGNYAINYATLTLDLSNYSESSNLELSFWWAEHGDEEHANDKVWIRGSDTDSWVVIYDLDPASITDDTYQFVSELDIDDILASASQTVSSSFQLRFGQEDDYNTDWDGLSFDDIKIEDKAPCSSCFDPSDQTVSNITQTSVDLSWIENCSSSSWQIMLDTEGFDTTNYSPVLVDTIPYTWTGISENTNYDWYVRAVCDNNQFSNWVGPNTFSGVKPFDLPFIEDWENSDGEQYTNGQFYASNSFNWAFETNLQNQGRISWGTNTHLPLNGTGAMTMDRNPSSAGNYAINYATLTLDLSNYSESSNLELSFWWAEHGDEEHANDKVWIRGSDTDSWVVIYDLDPASITDDTYQFVSELDIDDILASASQTVSSSFQLRFGQEDDYNTDWDGLSFDDIKIEDKMSVSLVNVRKEPYLIYEGINTEMTVLWQLDDSASSILEWGTDLNYQSGSIISTEYSNDHQHSYKIPNLSLATKYYYNVISGENEHDGSFVSAPDTAATEVSFFAYGDHRTFPIRHDSVVKNIIDLLGDSSEQTFILSTGDLVSSGDIEQDWDDQLFDPSYSNINQLLHSLPFQATMGNHERDGILFAKYLPYEFAGGGGIDGNYYSFDYGSVHITIINQYTDYTVGSDQHNWLINDLSGSTKPWKIIALHEPGWAAGHYPNNTDVQDIIQPLCETYSVQMVFAGHVHYYSRASVNGVIHITTGGGGSNLYDPEDGYPNVDTAVKAYHFCKIDISGDTLRLAAIDQNGDTIDNFILENNFKSKQIFVDDDNSINDIDDFNVYAHRDKIYIKSIGDSKNYPKTIIIYDAYGRKMNELYLGPSLTNEIYVITYSGNTNVRLVKVVTEKKVSVSKVFVSSN